MFTRRKNVKKYFASIAISMLVLIFSAQMIFAQEYTIKFGENFPLDSTRGITSLIFKDIVERASHGEIKVDIYPSSQLGNQDELTAAVKMGSVEMAWCFYPSVNEKYTIISMPFLFDSWDQAIKLINSPFIEKLNKESEANGYHVLSMFVETPRNITNNKRPIEKPDDLKGLLLRVPPIEVIAKSISAMGANPQSIPFSDLYMALKTGVVDGADHPLNTLKDQHFYEVQKYLSYVEYLIFPGVLGMNLDFYNSLPVKYQKLVDYAAKSATNYFIWTLDTEEREYDEFLRGIMEANDITPENHALFVEKTKHIWQEYIDEGYFTQEDIDEIKDFVHTDV